MKRSLLISLILCVLLVFATSAWSLDYHVGLTNVGSMDNLIAYGSPGSGDQQELDWVRTKTGDNDLILADKYTIMNWQLTNEGSGVYAIDLANDAPDYFLVKIGAGNAGIPIPDTSPQKYYDHYLFENLESLQWGVISLSAIGLSITNITGISHVDEFTTVPEPVTMLLLGLGLVGLAGVRRFRK